MKKIKQEDFEKNYVALIRYIKALEDVIRLNGKPSSASFCPSTLDHVLEVLKTDIYNQVQVETPNIRLEYRLFDPKRQQELFNDIRYRRHASISGKYEPPYTHIKTIVHNSDGKPIETYLHLNDDLRVDLSPDILHELIETFFLQCLTTKVKGLENE